MKNRISLLEEYKINIKNKSDLDNGIISLDDLSLEELEGVSKLYVDEIKSIDMEIEKTKADIEELKKENIRLKMLIRNGDKQ